MKKLLISLIFSLSLTACATPTAPLQPESGTISNYNQNQLMRFSARRFGGSRYSVNNSTTEAVSTHSDGTVSVNNIPFFHQGEDNTCGQATLTSALNFNGVDIDYQTVINESNPVNMATDINTITNYIKSKGLEAVSYKNSEIEHLRRLIDQGKPPIVLLDYGGLNNEHYVLVSGYNDKEGFLLINDPKQSANIKADYEIFEEMWENQSLGNLLIFGDNFYKPIIEIG